MHGIEGMIVPGPGGPQVFGGFDSGGAHFFPDCFSCPGHYCPELYLPKRLIATPLGTRLLRPYSIATPLFTGSLRPDALDNDLPTHPIATLLLICYAVSRTDEAYGATRLVQRHPCCITYALATRCPVLRPVSGMHKRCPVLICVPGMARLRTTPRLCGARARPEPDHSMQPNGHCDAHVLSHARGRFEAGWCYLHPDSNVKTHTRLPKKEDC
eukprot:935074-Rhodomonas_salina.2